MRTRASIHVALFGLGLALAAGCSTPTTDPAEAAKESVRLYKDGVALFSRGQIDQGIAKLQQGKQLEPTYTLLRYDLGRMLLTRAFRNEDESGRLGAEAKTMRDEGRLNEARQKEAEAKDLHDLAVRDLREAQAELLYVEPAMPNEPNVPYFLSKVYTGLEEYETAIEYLKRAMDRGNATAQAREGLERALQLLERLAAQKKERS